MKQLIPVGSVTGDPKGVRRYMEIDTEHSVTGACRTVLLNPDGTEYKPDIRFNQNSII
jgi:hypothetical protein